MTELQVYLLWSVVVVVAAAIAIQRLRRSASTRVRCVDVDGYRRTMTYRVSGCRDALLATRHAVASAVAGGVTTARGKYATTGWGHCRVVLQ